MRAYMRARGWVCSRALTCVVRLRVCELFGVCVCVLFDCLVCLFGVFVV